MTRKITIALALLAAALYLSPYARAGVILEGSTDALEVVTTSTASIDYNCNWSNVTATALTTPGTTKGNINTATTTTVIAAPSASNFRHIRSCTFRNAGTTDNTLTLQRDVSGTNRLMHTATLRADEVLSLGENGEISLYDSTGKLYTRKEDSVGVTGRNFTILKAGTAKEAATRLYGFQKDGGSPGAWVPGTPGLNGDHISCDTSADATIAGAPLFPDPSTGSLFLTSLMAMATVANPTTLIDLLWYNTGLAVTTTTAQNITFGTLNARDAGGTTDGDGVLIALYVTTVTTNGAAITNMTASYTDSDGNAGNTATASLPDFPQSAVVGTWVPFALAAGDRGVRSVESVTLGTSLVTGAVSLMVYRPIVTTPVAIAGVGAYGMAAFPQVIPPGVRLYNNSCLQVIEQQSSGTTASSMWMNFVVSER